MERNIARRTGKLWKQNFTVLQCLIQYSSGYPLCQCELFRSSHKKLEASTLKCETAAQPPFFLLQGSVNTAVFLFRLTGQKAFWIQLLNKFGQAAAPYFLSEKQRLNFLSGQKRYKLELLSWFCISIKPVLLKPPTPIIKCGMMNILLQQSISSSVLSLNLASISQVL